MGASGWICFVPYDPEPSVAFRAARHAAFREDAYPPVRSELELHRLRKALANDIQELRRGPAELGNGPDRETMIAITEGQIDLIELELASLAPDFTARPLDDQIEALIARCAENGTHSILDFHSVAETPGFGKAAPLTKGERRALFGTERPTRAQVTEKQDALIQHRCRGMASYVIVYEGEEPTEIAFAGISGD